eukprot:6213699-Pleurochrysis_carterae.AAC.1
MEGNKGGTPSGRWHTGKQTVSIRFKDYLARERALGLPGVGSISLLAAVATPALHHCRFLCLHVQRCSPPEHWLAWKQIKPPPPFRQGWQEGQSDGASTGKGA